MNDPNYSDENNLEDIEGGECNQCHQNQSNTGQHSHRHGMCCGGKWHLMMIALLAAYLIIDFIL